MAASVRERTRSGAPVVGRRITISSGAVTTSSYTSSVDYCEDVVGNYPNANPLFIEHRVLRPGTLTGRITSFPTYQFEDFAYTNQPANYSWWPTLSDASPSNAAAISEVLAKTNPSRPSVSLPNFVFELKDALRGFRLDNVVELLRNMLFPYVKPDIEFEIRGKRRKWIKRHKRRAVAKPQNSTVSHNFGFDLFMQDLLQILRFAEDVEKRRLEIESAYSKRGLRRRRVVHTRTQKLTESVQFHSAGASVIGTRATVQSLRKWVTVQWKGKLDAVPSAGDMLAQARLAVHGWDLSAGAIASTMWDAMPWSWLADYFGNIGDFLASQRNLLGITPHNICVCTEYTKEVIDNVTSTSPGITSRGGKCFYQTLNRAPGTLALTARVSVLTSKQLLTLSSIVVNHRNTIDRTRGDRFPSGRRK